MLIASNATDLQKSCCKRPAHNCRSTRCSHCVAYGYHTAQATHTTSSIRCLFVAPNLLNRTHRNTLTLSVCAVRTIAGYLRSIFGPRQVGTHNGMNVYMHTWTQLIFISTIILYMCLSMCISACVSLCVSVRVSLYVYQCA